MYYYHEQVNLVMFCLPLCVMRHVCPQVNSWLSEVFGDQPVPHFEVNTRTVDILFQLAQSSEARCRDTALLSEDLKQKASEYQAEGEEQTQLN